MANPNPKAFLGKGWAFPLPQDPSAASVPLSEFEDNVRQSILVILGTRRGERVMDPEFGSELQNLVFEPANETTATRISEAVREALIQWEPRIVVNRVDTSVNEGQAGRMDAEISYTVSRTNTVFNLVYPFYLLRQ